MTDLMLISPIYKSQYFAISAHDNHPDRCLLQVTACDFKREIDEQEPSP